MELSDNTNYMSEIVEIAFEKTSTTIGFSKEKHPFNLSSPAIDFKEKTIATHSGVNFKLYYCPIFCAIQALVQRPEVANNFILKESQTFFMAIEVKETLRAHEKESLRVDMTIDENFITSRCVIFFLFPLLNTL
ncbi:hypothetical protein GLOIN_2v1785275 [Rhizophagus irregularis DAOM 181602=DAOM 197198]|nr:hypothetical protein GLOIN_2v1785275 [Rhizophagus irregularis DAOM 181602=DAOM 197198]